MAGKTLTAANSVILLTVPGLFDTPVQLQGYATDDVFDTDAIEPAETMMGVDGKLSAGWVPKEIKQSYTLQADSDSVQIFDVWYQAQQRVREILRCSGTVILPAVAQKMILSRGVLTSFQPATAKKVLQPRKFTITWESLRSVPN